MKLRAIVGIIVGSSSRVLNRAMIVKCNDTGGHSLANSVAGVGNRRVTGGPTAGPLSSLRKGVTNIRVVGGKHTNSSPRVHVHKAGSVGNCGPLCVMSKLFGSGVGFLGPRSVRSVRMLGSPSSLTVFNMHNTGNMVVVAAGGTGRKRAEIGVGASFN